MIFHENTSCITPIDRAIKRYTNAKVGTVKIYSKLSISAFLSWSNRSCFSARTVAMTNYLCDVNVVISTASTERDRTTITGNVTPGNTTTFSRGISKLVSSFFEFPEKSFVR